MKHILREITPLAKDRLYFAKNTPDDPMDFPLHFHDDFELTLTLNVEGKRIVGNMVEPIGRCDLVLFGPNVLHCYKRADEYVGVKSNVTVIQFSRHITDSDLFDKDPLRPIGKMLSQASVGIRFSDATAQALRQRILELPRAEGLHGVTLFLEILYSLATSESQTLLSAVPTSSHIHTDNLLLNCERINRIIQFVEANYMNRLTLEDVGDMIQMSPSAVSRFFKRKTQHNLWSYLNNFRIDRAAQRIVETEEPVSQICYSCGFNNVSNFNRIFRDRMGITPSEYRRRIRSSIVR